MRVHCPLRYLDTNCVNVKDILGFQLELNFKILYFMKLNEVHLEMPQSICIFLIIHIVTIATVIIILKIYIAQP